MGQRRRWYRLPLCTAKRVTMVSNMRVFLVTINTGTDIYRKAKTVITAVGAKLYNDAEDLLDEGVQDPYRAVDESDVIVWVTNPSGNYSRKLGGYNPLYGDSVLQRSVSSGKPVLYYQLKSTQELEWKSDILKQVTQVRTPQSSQEFEIILRADLLNVISQSITPKNSR